MFKSREECNKGRVKGINVPVSRQYKRPKMMEKGLKGSQRLEKTIRKHTISLVTSFEYQSEHFSEETREEHNINLKSLIQHQFCHTLNSKTMFWLYYIGVSP